MNGIGRDITQRKLTQAALRRSEFYLAESQRLGKIGTWAWNVAGRNIVYWSAEHYRIFGFDPRDGPVPIQAAAERIHPDDRSILDEIVHWMSHKDSSFCYSLRLILPDGSLKYVRSIGHSVVDESGRPAEFMGVLADVTESTLVDQTLQSSYEQLRGVTARLERAREEERKKIAREIHDELAQGLTAIKLELTSLARSLPLECAQQSERVVSILTLVGQMVESVGRISTELRPWILDDLGFAAAVKWVAKEFEVRTGITCELALQADRDLMGRESCIAMFRIFQEALTNIARHAEATHVLVRFEQEENQQLLLEVQDDGRGITEEQASAKGSMGILGMKERAVLLGGEFSICGVDGKGTIARVRLPQPNLPPSQPRDLLGPPR